MARSDRVAQLMALLQDAREKGDTDKIIEIEADLFKEYSLEMRGGGMMDINDMLKPVGYKEGPPKGMAVGDMEKMGEALIRQAMMDAEKKRLEDYDPKDPETFSESTYGTITDDIRLKVALQIARSQGDTSSENIDGSVSKEESVSFGGKNREELKKIVEDMIPMEGVGGDLLRGIASGIGMPIMGAKKMMEDISELINKKKTD